MTTLLIGVCGYPLSLYISSLVTSWFSYIVRISKMLPKCCQCKFHNATSLLCVIVFKLLPARDIIICRTKNF